MKLSVKFVKKHVSGIQEGRVIEFEFSHGLRLIEEGWCEPADGEDLDEKKKLYEEQQEQTRSIVAERVAQLQAAEEEDEAKKEAMRQDGAQRKHQRMSTADIQSEQPKNPGKKAGKK
jgi:hypothetical protein